MNEESISDRSAKIDDIQSNQYTFPYHYIPTSDGFPNFSKEWSFSPSYLAAINLFQEWLESEIKSSTNHLHMDYGCGDGGFIYNVKSQGNFNGVDFYGIDFDKKAIEWASLFNSGSNNFTNDDITNLKSSWFDSGSLVEVLEHIPPTECSTFISCIAKSLKSEASLFVTVPSNQKPTFSKHYRHFDFETLANEFKEHFHVEEVFGFERINFTTRVLKRCMKSRWWYLEIKFINQYLINSYYKKYSDIKGCGRIGMTLRKK